MFALLLATLLAIVAPAQRPVAGTVITKSTRVPAGTYDLPSADRAHPAIVIRGSNITVDFTGVTLRGGRPEADPDTCTGLALLVDGGENVTIKGLAARGYKIGVYARKSPGLHITGGNFSYNWKQRLYSLVEHESLLDWMSYHHNDKDGWLDQGAGIYLADSDRVEIDRTTISQGQNGLLLARSNGAISDDGIRVWMDDERIIDHWAPHESAVDAAAITGGKRRFKVEYYEIGGFAELRFEILRR